jgi:transcriptional regulator GlxA family with amidase domain
MHRVVVLALDGVIPFELGIPSRIFGAALGADAAPLYDVITCTLDGRPVASAAGFTISVTHGLDVLESADTVVIPPSDAHVPIRDHGRLDARLANALTRIPPQARIASICTASYVLAAAGLLDGRPATTHWQESMAFQRTFPQVRLDADVLFVDDGRVLTSAGAASGVDMCLHLVRRDHGTEVANRVARRCVVPPWRHGGQAQYIEQPVPDPTAASTTLTRAWALDQLRRPLTLAELAEHARMSVRTFSRRFRAETGMAPGRWVIRQRVALACRLLETSDLPIDQIAERTGFATSGTLRLHLRTAIGVSPATYRRTFRTGHTDRPAPDRSAESGVVELCP